MPGGVTGKACEGLPMSIFRVGYDAVRQDANGVRRLRSPPVGRGTSRNPKNEGLTLNPVTLNPAEPWFAEL